VNISKTVADTATVTIEGLHGRTE